MGKQPANAPLFSQQILLLDVYFIRPDSSQQPIRLSCPTTHKVNLNETCPPLNIHKKKKLKNAHAILRGFNQSEREDVSCRRGQGILILGSSQALSYTLLVWGSCLRNIHLSSQQPGSCVRCCVANGRPSVELRVCVCSC